MQKLLKVISSCQSWEQLEIAKKYMALYLRIHPEHKDHSAITQEVFEAERRNMFDNYGNRR